MAQQVVETKSFRLLTTKYDHVLSYTDGIGNMAFAFYKKRKLEIKVLSASYFVTAGKSISLNELDRSSKMIGLDMDDKFVNVFFYSTNSHVFSVCRYNKFLVTEMPTYEALGNVPIDESILKGFVISGKFRLLSLRKNGDVICRTVENNQVVVDEFKHEYSALYSTLLSQNGNLESESLSELGIDKIEYYADNDIGSAKAKNKLYVVGKKIHIVIDEKSSTKILTLDIASKNSRFKKYNFHLERCESSDLYGGNSFLYKDKLFRITLCREMLNISTVHLDSNALLKTYNVFNDQPFTFKNGSILVETNYEKESDDLEVIESTSKFLRKIENTNLAIAVNKVKFDNYLVFVGGTQTTTYSQNNGFSPGFGGFGFGTGLSLGIGLGTGMGMGNGMGMGGMGYPYNNNMNSYNNYKKTKNIYFKTMLESKDLNHINGNTPKTIKEVLKGYSETNLENLSPTLITTTGSETKIIYGYLNGKDDLYHLLEINR